MDVTTTAKLSIPVKRDTSGSSWKLVVDKTTPDGGTYSGPASLITFHFSVESTGIVPVNDWLLAHVVDDAAAATVDKAQAKLLRVRVWKRFHFVTGILDYAAELTITAPPAGLAQGSAAVLAALPLWATMLIYAAVAAIIIYLLVKPILDGVIDLVYGPPGSGTPGLGGLIILGGLALVAASKWGGSKTKDTSSSGK